jgi:hypothetical protein
VACNDRKLARDLQAFGFRLETIRSSRPCYCPKILYIRSVAFQPDDLAPLSRLGEAACDFSFLELQFVVGKGPPHSELLITQQA